MRIDLDIGVMFFTKEEAAKIVSKNGGIMDRPVHLPNGLYKFLSKVSGRKFAEAYIENVGYIDGLYKYNVTLKRTYGKP